MLEADLDGVDVLVVGAGNAAACAALSAREAGAKVAMLETALRKTRGAAIPPTPEAPSAFPSKASTIC